MPVRAPYGTKAHVPSTRLKDASKQRGIDNHGYRERKRKRDEQSGEIVRIESSECKVPHGDLLIFILVAMPVHGVHGNSGQ